VKNHRPPEAAWVAMRPIVKRLEEIEAAKGHVPPPPEEYRFSGFGQTFRFRDHVRLRVSEQQMPETMHQLHVAAATGRNWASREHGLRGRVIQFSVEPDGPGCYFVDVEVESDGRPVPEPYARYVEYGGRRGGRPSRRPLATGEDVPDCEPPLRGGLTGRLADFVVHDELHWGNSVTEQIMADAMRREVERMGREAIAGYFGVRPQYLGIDPGGEAGDETGAVEVTGLPCDDVDAEMARYTSEGRTIRAVSRDDDGNITGFAVT
jgi:hypothetical protein